MELKSGYKQTEVGVIPEDWEVSFLSSTTLKIQDGTHFSPKLGGNDFLYITSKNIRHGYIDLSKVDRIDTEQHKAIYKRCDVKYGDLLLTKDGASTGNAAFNSMKEEFSLLSSVALLRFDSNKHDANYFLQQILSQAGQQRISEAMSGNAITRLTLDKIKKLVYPIPPTKTEQTAIANALSDADALIQSLTSLIAKKCKIKQGAMQILLTGEKRLSGFQIKPGYKQTEVGVIPEDWSVAQLNEVADKITVGFVGTMAHLFRSEGIPLLRGQNVLPHKLNLLDTKFISSETHKLWKKSSLRTGDVVMVRVGYPGTACVIPDDLGEANAASLVVVTPKPSKLDSNFLCYIVNSEFGRRQIDSYLVGGAQQVINTTTAAIFKLPLPPTKTEQIAIAAILSGMDTEIAVLEAKLAKYRHIKQGMMQNLLTGRIRLVQPDNNTGAVA